LQKINIMGKFTHPDITRLQREKEKQSNPYWVTDCTYDIELKYSYEEEKNKIRQTQSC